MNESTEALGIVVNSDTPLHVEFDDAWVILPEGTELTVPPGSTVYMRDLVVPEGSSLYVRHREVLRARNA